MNSKKQCSSILSLMSYNVTNAVKPATCQTVLQTISEACLVTQPLWHWFSNTTAIQAKKLTVCTGYSYSSSSPTCIMGKFTSMRSLWLHCCLNCSIGSFSRYLQRTTIMLFRFPAALVQQTGFIADSYIHGFKYCCKWLSGALFQKRIVPVLKNLFTARNSIRL